MDSTEASLSGASGPEPSLSSFNPSLSTTTKSSSRILPKVPDKAAAPVCKSNEDLVQRQALYLKQAIKEAKKAEEKRLFIVEIEKNPARVAELEERFKVQRQLDQEKIIRLKQDYDGMKAAIAKGELNIQERNETRSTIPMIKTKGANRFAGIETEADLVFQKAVCEKYFNPEVNAKHMGSIAARRQRFDFEAEKNKVRLFKS